MRLYTSNRAEHLAAHLCDVLATPVGDALEPDTVIVHSPGMEAWLSQQIALRLGVCANVDFPYPAHFLPKLFEAVLGEQAAGVDAWAQSNLRWAILAELSARLAEPDFDDVARYVSPQQADTPLLSVSGPLPGADGAALPPIDALKLVQLAERVARVFSGYLYYRPEMISQWASTGAGADAQRSERWQALLWRGVRERLGAPNVVELADRFVAALAAGRAPDGAPAPPAPPPTPQLSLDFGAAAPPPPPRASATVAAQAAPLAIPRRVCLFGVSTLPRLQLELVAALARVADVHLFVLAPSREFFADIRSAREIARHVRRTAQDPSVSLLAMGNPLLASFGKLGRDFQQQMLDAELPIRGGAETFVDPFDAVNEAGATGADANPAPADGASAADVPAGATALAVLQSDILNLRHRGAPTSAAAPPLPPTQLRPDDASIAIHACHGPMRQVEVLHDLLVDRFQRDPTLTPADVIVMCPDLETFGPLIEAVFQRQGDSRYIPFRIADRSLRRESPVAEAFLAVLTLVDSRMSAPAVMDVISMPAVHERFGIAADDVPTLVRWVRETGIRWGIDAEHRVEHGQPGYEQNTWRFGLDRAVLGAAMVGEGRRLFADVLPYDQVEGGDAQLLGRFAALADALFERCRTLAAPRTLAAWRDTLSEALAALVAQSNESAWQHEQIRRVLEEAARAGASVTSGGVDAPALAFPLSVMRSILSDALSEGRSPHGFLTGAATFCEMLPMRSIPFRLVGMLGMDERAFPRSSTRFGFDLVAQSPHVGDRSLRDDDRYLFLEALLSARDALIVTFTGQSVRDNSALPPSVCVAELLDVCGESFFVDGADASEPTHVRRERVIERLVTRQALQPFSERYFRDDVEDLFTYAREFHSGARSLRAPKAPPPPFVSDVAPPGPARSAADVVEVDEFVRFFRSPIRAWFRGRLDVTYPRDAAALLDREPIVLDRLERSLIAGRLLDRAVAGEALSAAQRPTRAEGVLPLGNPGDAAFDQTVGSVAPLESEIRALRGGDEVGYVDVALTIAPRTLVGRVRGVFGRRLVHHQYSRVQGEHELAAWVRHLIACAVSEELDETVLIGRPGPQSPGMQHHSRGLGVQVIRYRRPADPARLLATLLELYAAGLAEPLLLFPRTSFAWAMSRDDSVPREARNAWAPFGGGGESEDRYVRTLLGEVAPWDIGLPDRGGEPALGALPSHPNLSFRQLIRTVFDPLKEHREA
ncbi:MAG: exodeoxyribonuclease V subunit gamma [Myxococcales bacterium]|nr:exodeoxyribonuclease V subunit gamma [Myxococcales bacterium]